MDLIKIIYSVKILGKNPCCRVVNSGPTGDKGGFHVADLLPDLGRFQV